MDDDKWEEIREAHRIIEQTMREYLRSLNTAKELIDSSLDVMERSRKLLSEHLKLRELAHVADVQVAKAAESLTIDVWQSDGTSMKS